MKQKVLSMLALLLMAATGAWADPNSIVINGTPQVGDKSISLTYHFDPANVPGLDYGYAPTLKVKCAADNKWDETLLSSTDVSSGTTNISLSNLGEFEAGKTYEVCFAYNNGNWVDEVFQSFVPAADAPAGYTVSLKDGVKDADKWTVKVGEGQAQALPIGGLKGDGSETVTLTYNGRLKVKGVTATSDAAPKPDLLPAVFTVEAGKTVKFSKGNLQATYNGSSRIWGFAEHQWDYIGNAAGNTSINGNGTVSANGTVDLFGWVGASSTWTGAAQYGISNSTATNNVDGYGNVAGEAQKVGWGATVGEGWRTLTRLEWLYLLSTRETGVTVNSTDNARYTLAIINTDGTAVKGLIIFPDSYAGGSPAGVTWGTINAKSTFETTCTSAGWTALEAAGCVFLPAAGYREASTVKEAGDGAGYWSSSSSNTAYAFGLWFESEYMSIQYGGSRKYGFSVRLVQATSDAEPAEATPALSITSPSVGQVIGSDGKNYAADASLPSGVTAVAKICYVSGSNGLALALTDEGKMNWSTAQTTCAAHTPAFTGGTWKLATKDEWSNIISAAGSYTDLRDGFSSVGGSNMNKGYYWSSTEDGTDYAEAYYFGNIGGGGWFSMYKTSDGYNVRACLAF